MAVAFGQTLRAVRLASPWGRAGPIGLVAVALALWSAWLLTPALPIEERALSVTALDRPLEEGWRLEPGTQRYLAVFPSRAQRRMRPGAGGYVLLADDRDRVRKVAVRVAELLGDGLRVVLQSAGSAAGTRMLDPVAAVVRAGGETPIGRLLATSPPDPETVVLQTAGGRFEEIAVGLATSPAEQGRGPAGRDLLRQGRGVLLVHPRPQETSIWTEAAPVALDIVFIGATGRIAQIVRVGPSGGTGLVRSRKPVLAVLELPSGEAERLGIAPGDRVLSRLVRPGREGAGRR